MTNKFTLPIIIVCFLIGETLLFGFGIMYADQTSQGQELNLETLRGQLSSAIASFYSQKIEFVWENGQRKKFVLLSELVTKYQRAYNHQENWRVDYQKLAAFLQPLAKEINTEPQNPSLVWEEKGRRVKEFTLPKDGQKLNVSETSRRLASSLMSGKTSVVLAIDKIPPSATATEETMNFSSLLAGGESNFKGSPVNRIQNIRVGSSKLHGIVIGPGEIFSFNGIVGSVDAENEFKSELVIKNGRVTPEYGGGLCQVSTTLFRAAVLAGLPIIERKGHSLPVHYYDPQGFDATVYPDVTDLKFRNDTPGYLLIQRKIQGTILTFELYGISDERAVEITGPLVYEQKGGILKTILTRAVQYADGRSVKEEFRTGYRSAVSSPNERNPLE